MLNLDLILSLFNDCMFYFLIAWFLFLVLVIKFFFLVILKVNIFYSGFGIYHILT